MVGGRSLHNIHDFWQLYAPAAATAQTSQNTGPATSQQIRRKTPQIESFWPDLETFRQFSTKSFERQASMECTVAKWARIFGRPRHSNHNRSQTSPKQISNAPKLKAPRLAPQDRLGQNQSRRAAPVLSWRSLSADRPWRMDGAWSMLFGTNVG